MEEELFIAVTPLDDIVPIASVEVLAIRSLYVSVSIP